MDAKASKEEDAEINKLLSLYMEINNLSYPSLHMKQNKSVVKYTRIPDFDIKSDGKAIDIHIYF